MPTTNITIRMDEKLKKEFSHLCEEIGMSMGTAFTVFAKAVVREKGIPFNLTAQSPNKETMEAMLEAERIAIDSSVQKYDSPVELFKALQNEV